MEIFLGPGPVPGFEKSRFGPRFLKLSQSWSELFLDYYIFSCLGPVLDFLILVILVRVGPRSLKINGLGPTWSNF